MIFASLVFLFIFLPLNLTLYYLIPNIKIKNIILIAFSLTFYAWGEPVWMLLLVFTALLDYNHARQIEKYRGTKRAKFHLLASVITDIGIFSVVKYSGFFATNLNLLPGIDIPVPEFALPAGISFYTFQTLTYIIDVYRGSTKAQEKFSNYILYLSLYFQLVAGPIVRYTDVERDIHFRQLSVPKFSKGIYRFVLGLGKKVIIADVAGTFVEKYMLGDISTLTTLGAWFGILMFTIQLYFDFSGYSDMAIGLGHMFGFHFPENFNYPYISKSVSEFWRRWHMTLGSFFRDYVYIPLGGNRRHILRNLLVVWFLTGFWHGASWNFIVWGLYNGLFIIIEKLTKKHFDKIPAIIRHIYLLVVVNIGFVFFKFTDINDAFSYIGAMFTNNNGFTSLSDNTTIFNNIFWIALAVILCMPVMKLFEKMYNNSVKYDRFVLNSTLNYARLILICAILIISVSHMTGNTASYFLYHSF